MAKSGRILILYLVALCEILTIFSQANYMGILSFYIALFECAFVAIYILLAFYNKRIKKSTLFLFAGIIGFLLLSIFVHGTGIEYMCNFLLLFLTLFYVMLDSKEEITFNRKNKRICYFPILLLLVLLFIKTPKGDPNLVLMQGQVNPNTFGFILFIASTVFLSLYSDAKKPIILLLSFVCFALQLLYSSRISLLSNALVYLLYFVTRKNKSGYLKWLYAVFIFIMILQITFPYLYAEILFKLIGKGKVFILGKDIFTGRQIIWSEWFEQMQGNYLLGIGNNFVSSWVMDGVVDGKISIHNSSLAIISNFGIITYLFYLFFVARLLKPKSSLPLTEKNSNKLRMNLIFLSAVMINGLTDTVLISAFNVGGIVLGLLLINMFKFENPEVKF